MIDQSEELQKLYDEASEDSSVEGTDNGQEVILELPLGGDLDALTSNRPPDERREDTRNRRSDLDRSSIISDYGYIPAMPPPKKTLREKVSEKVFRHSGLKLLQVAMAVYIGILTLRYGSIRNRETGLIVDPTSETRTGRGVILMNGIERAIVADSTFQVICLAITRMSAFFMYPGKRYNPRV